MSGPVGRAAEPSDAVVGIVPKVVYTPASVEEAAQVLAQTRTMNAAIAFVGGGSELELGAPPRALEAVLRTERLNRIVEYIPDDMVMTVEAGVPLASLQRTTAEHGQQLALDPPSPDRSTVGGLVATNAFGPRRARYGSIKDLIIGATLILEDGTITRGGGKVVKNVAGFDVPKLICGSLGTLGMVATATFRLHPRPEASETVLVPGQSATTLRALIAAARDAQLEPSSCVAFWRQDRWDVAFRFEGFASGLKQQTERLAAIGTEQKSSCDRIDSAAAQELWSEHDHIRTQAELRVKFGSLSSDLTSIEAEWLAPLLRTVGEAQAAWHPTLGIGFVSGRVLDPARTAKALESLRSALTSRGGSLVLTAAPAAVRQQIDVWGPPPSAFQLMRRIKDRFDPDARLNPGRFVGGL